MSDWQDREHPDTIVLFDVDGTLTPARRVINFKFTIYFNLIN